MGTADKETTPALFSASIGLGGRGLIPGRQEDHYGLGYFYINLADTRVKDALNFSEENQSSEAFYNIILVETIQLTLDLQLLDAPAPAPAPDSDGAVVLGARLNTVFQSPIPSNPGAED